MVGIPMTENNLRTLSTAHIRGICLKTCSIDLGKQGVPLPLHLFEDLLQHLDTELLKTHKMLGDPLGKQFTND